MTESGSAPGPTSKRRSRGELLLLLLGLTIAAVGLELVCRLIETHAPPKLGYAPVRGHRSREPQNAAGYRDTEHARVKPASVHRAVFLGDSFTYGVGVLLDDTYPKRVERALSASRAETWESLVFAVPGIDSEQEEQIFENEALAYSPDVVVLGYVLNDAEDENAAEIRRAAEWTEHEREKANPAWWRKSAFLSLVGDRLHATRENHDRIANHLALYQSNAPGFLSVRKSIARMASLCQDRHIPFVVLVFPLFANPLNDSYPFKSIHEKVDALCRSLGAHVVDLLPSYRDLDWHLLVVEGEHDEHPNEVAHRIAAQGLVAELSSILRPRAQPSKVGSYQPLAAGRADS
ncbi:MAG: SGNH/GDSL hydrolase family protein [Vicinamibacteria bacterium]